jgi:hypothetical protein
MKTEKFTWIVRATRNGVVQVYDFTGTKKALVQHIHALLEAGYSEIDTYKTDGGK